MAKHVYRSPGGNDVLFLIIPQKVQVYGLRTSVAVALYRITVVIPRMLAVGAGKEFICKYYLGFGAGRLFNKYTVRPLVAIADEDRNAPLYYARLFRGYLFYRIPKDIGMVEADICNDTEYRVYDVR